MSAFTSDFVAKLKNTVSRESESHPPALVRDTVLKQMGGPLSESVEVDVVPRVRKHRNALV